MAKSSPKRSKNRPSSSPPAQRRLRIEKLEDRSMLSSIAVTNLNDHGAGSLRQAILTANSSSGADTITFGVAGTIQLTSGALPTLLTQVDLDGATAPGFAGAPKVEVDFHGYSGLTLAAGASGSTIQSLDLVGAAMNGVTLNRANNVTIEGNYIGLALDGMTVDANKGDGLMIGFSTGDTIGGTTAADRNVISGNGLNGIELTGSSNNTIEGNYLGTNSTGTLDRGNTGNGILLAGISKNNIVGGTSGNLISGNNSNGVLINGESSGNSVAGNTIGLAANGSTVLGNSGDGVKVQNATGNTIGSSSSVQYYSSTGITLNVNGVQQPVSGWQGITAGDTAGQYLMTGTSDSDGLLYEGTISGTGTTYAVNYPGAYNTSVYGTYNAGSGNLQMVGTYKNANYATAPVFANGFVFTGTTADLGNAANYATIDYPGAKYNYVHSTANGLAVGNYDNPVDHGEGGLPFGPGNAFIYNIASKSFTPINLPGAVSVSAYGIVYNGANSYTIVGGYSNVPANNFTNQDQPIGQAYIVDYNSATGKFTNFTSISYPQGVSLATHFEGISSLGNGSYTLAATSMQIGASAPSIASIVTISRTSNGSFGTPSWVNVNYPGATISSNDSVSGDAMVGVASGGTIYQATINQAFQLSNVISGNGANGIELSAASGNTVSMNNIGTDSSGNLARGNAGAGILITAGSANNMIGGEATGGNAPTTGVFVRPPQGNLISGNTGDGVLINGGASNNQLSGNFIGTTAGGSVALGNQGNGVEIVNANNNDLQGCLFTTSPFVFYNVISGNNGNGLVVNNSNGTTIQANFFGVGADNKTGIGNKLNGVLIEGSSTNTVMGGPIPLGNVDSANGQNGIVVQDTASAFTSYNTFDGLAAFSYLPTLGNGHDGMLITTTGQNILIRTNVITENGNDGIEIGGNATGVREDGNIVGLSTDGTVKMGNKNNGIEVDGNANGDLLGSPQPTFNVIPQSAISGNANNGVAIDGNAHNITVNNAYIGTDITGNSARSNGGAGVYIGPGSYGNTIGGIDATVPTVIDSNTGGGIVMNGTTGNTVIATKIGVAANGSALGNTGSGISLTASSKNTIGSASSSILQNTIANNTASGVIIHSGTQDALHQNSIYSNTSLGITLAAGANNNQAAPVLATVNATSTATQVTGALHSAANTTYVIEFFASSANGGSGRYLLGSTTVKTNAQGVATINFSGIALPSGNTYVTATATDPLGNTSQFSAALA